MRLLISAVIWDEFLRSGMCQLELVPLADKYGCAGIEFRPYWRSPIDELPEVKEFLAEYGLCSTYACNENLLAESEGATRRSLAEMEASLIMAERLGSLALRINVAAGVFDRKILTAAWWQSAVRRLIDEAANKNVLLVVENAPDPERGDPRLIRDLLATFDSPWLKATFDTGNWLPAGVNPAEALVILQEYVGYVHLKDMQPESSGFLPSYPGCGAIDIRNLVSRLEQAGYDGYYALEFPGGQSPALSVKASLKYLGQEIG